MSPILIALLIVTALFAVFWTTRTNTAKGKKWFSRIAAFVVLYVLAGVLAGNPQMAAKAGEYAVYLGVPAVLIYYVARARA